MKKIKFPEEYQPSNSSLHVRNELFIPSSKESIWFWLTNVRSWPEWYSNSSNVEIIDSNESRLNKDTKFNWRTFNTNVKSEVREFDPGESLAWIAKGTGLTAYHSWLIIPQFNGCLVITEETQKGWMPHLFKWFIKKGLLKQHQRWLEGLREKAMLIS